MYTSRRLVALHTVARCLYGRWPTHDDMVRLYLRMVRAS